MMGNPVPKIAAYMFMFGLTLTLISAFYFLVTGMMNDTGEGPPEPPYALTLAGIILMSIGLWTLVDANREHKKKEM